MPNKFKNPNTPKLWDKLLFANNKELLESAFYNDKINKVYKYIKKTKGNFLDIGFGRGNLEKKISNHNLDINIYGIDFSTKTVLTAKKEIKGIFKVGNIFKLPFKSSFFNSIAILDVLEHIEKNKILIALAEVNRVLKRGGNLVISVPLNENLKQLNLEGRNFNAHLREYTLSVIAKELNKAGLVVSGHEYLFAFRKLYRPKSFLIKFASFLKKPNLLIVYCNKK